MQDVSPLAPEQRARRIDRAKAGIDRHLAKVSPGTYPFEVAKRVVVGVYSDGFIHAGNLAYLALMSLFPFFIVMAALAQILGRDGDSLHAVTTFLHTLPPRVADVLAKPIGDVLAARSGMLLWLGGFVGLWTVGSFIETIRDILRRAYGTRFSKAFWRYRLASAAIIVASVILLMLAFSAQIILTGAEEFVVRLLPFAEDVAGWIGLSQIAPAVALFGALYFLFYSLTPSKYRFSPAPKWPGALFTAVWWMGTTMVLPKVLGLLGGYDLTYGGLAGVIITLLFFYLVGLGLVFGAHLNAALAESPEAGLKEAGSE